ncbi:hypothetical protein LPJ53_001643 [Coemansia erecta]|uniref:TTI1 C-terminal TPR domain-containing protein n=1 Tax=Coemansia erecta TaxID=147472 RepID=A0A9W7Y4Z9_9FUNG|nr:hypothetical protein LPJ53_001643 [Coemansia erecta]
MEIHHIAGIVAQCVQPGSAIRAQLGRHLDDLRRAAGAQRAAGADPGGAILGSVTLAFVQALTARPRLSDNEREKLLECVLAALTPADGQRLMHVHPAVVDHLSRQLVGIFALDTPGSGRALVAAPEATRLLALRCWRQMARVLGSVQIPNGGAAVSLTAYWAKRMPPDYLALAVCALLDNAEHADDMGLRREALDTLADVARPGGVFADAPRLLAVFPGVASALARVALAQPPNANAAPASASAAPPSAWRKPSAAARAQALDALRHVMATVFAAEDTGDKTPDDSGVDGWAGRMARAAQSIVQGETAEEEEEEQSGEPMTQLDRVLWRLAGLRHSEHASVVAAVRALFGCVALDCRGLQHTRAPAVAVEALLVVCMQNGTGSADREDEDAGWLGRLAQAAEQRPLVGTWLANAAASAQRQFERHVGGASDERRRDAVSLLAAALAATPDASAVFSAWWRARGLRALLHALHVELPGTALLLTAEPSASADAGCVLGGFRAPELRRVLDALLVQAAGAFGVQRVRAHVLDTLDGTPGDAEMRAAGLWVLAHDALAGGGAAAAALEYAGTCVAAPDPLVACVALRAVAGLAPECGAAAAYSLEPLLFPLLLASAAPPDSPASSVQRAHAGRALQALADACKADSVAAMLRANVDYIVDAGARRLRAADVGPEAFSVLRAAVRLMGGAFVVYAEDVVEDTLDVCERLAGLPVDEGDSVMVAALGFLEEVTGVVADVEAGKVRGHLQLAAPALAEKDDPVARVVAELREIDEHARMAELFDLPSDDDDDDEPIDPSTDVAMTDANHPSSPTADEPAGSPLAVKIALVVQNLLSSESSAQQLVALKIVQHCVRALKHTKDLLPLINHVWPTLVRRVSAHHHLGQDTFYVAAAACDVIDLVCSAGEAWMRRRVRDDLWMHFAGILAAPEDAGKLRPSERLLCARVLRAMATVAGCVPLEGKDAWTACCVPLRFVGVKETHDEAVALLRALVPVHGDSLWLVLASLGRTSLDPAAIPALPSVPSAQAVALLPPDICQTLGL